MTAGTTDEHNPKSVDDLFRLLVRIRGKSPLDARDEIQDALSHDRLGVDMHIAGGARRLLRAATPEEFKQAAEAKRQNRPWSWEFLYETLPREGRTTSVHYNCWRHGHMLDLEIKGERLVIVSHCAFDFPWESYSFTLTNWSAVEELWPSNQSRSSNQLAPASDTAQPPTRLPTPDEWLAEARELPRRPDESRTQWVDRLYELHRQASLSKHWSKATLSRRLYDET